MKSCGLSYADVLTYNAGCLTQQLLLQLYL